MLWNEMQNIIIGLLIVVSAFPAVIYGLRIISSYWFRFNPKYQKYLFMMNKGLNSLIDARHQTKWNRFFSVMFMLVSLVGAYRLYELLLKISSKQVSMAESWFQVFVLFMTISIGLQQLRPQKKSTSSI
jgi:predicted neutral ceramidase superfamily lipid hydrolase